MSMIYTLVQLFVLNLIFSLKDMKSILLNKQNILNKDNTNLGIIRGLLEILKYLSYRYVSHLQFSFS